LECAACFVQHSWAAGLRSAGPHVVAPSALCGWGNVRFVSLVSSAYIQALIDVKLRGIAGAT